MEPEGRPLTPGISYASPSLNSAQNHVLNCTVQQSSCSSDLSDVLTSAKDSQGPDYHEGPNQTEVCEQSADPARSAQRRFRSSAFPSSLNWDSDSEKETLDEEELQHFSNPHGLAAHSPGSPSSEIRVDCEDDKKTELKPDLEHEGDQSFSGEMCNKNKDSTKSEEPNTSHFDSIELGTNLDFKLKPKDACQMEEDTAKREGEKSLEGNDRNDDNDKERDVYAFPGDSEPETPLLVPRTNCALFQRCRTKKVLLGPFSGALIHTSPEASTQDNSSGPQRSISAELSSPSQNRGTYHYDDFGKELTDVPNIIRDGEETVHEYEDDSLEHDIDIFTCVECSIYFKKQVHLKEHMIEHCQTGEKGSEYFQCNECGWDLLDSVALANHQKKHQESRIKILAEIEKLNENERAKDKPDTKAAKQDSLLNLSDTFPPSYQAPMTVSDGELVSVQSNTSQSTPRSFGTKFQPRAVLYRRRFICTQCNFSTKTSQALANHTKTHMRKKETSAFKSSSSFPDPTKCSSPLSSCQIIKTKQRKHTHPALDSICRVQVNSESSLSSSDPASKSIMDADCLSQSNSFQVIDTFENDLATQVIFGCDKNRRFSRRLKIGSRSNEEEFPERQENLKESTKIDPENNAVEGCPRPGSDPAEHSEQPTNTSLQIRNNVKDEDEKEENMIKKDIILRSNYITASLSEIGSDDDDEDDVDEHVQHFLSEDILDGVEDEFEEGSDGLKNVERKCPYCPDRFHNGIGLANHVRGHLNRVGVSYNVRHFISPEEVNAIEKRFSYQKKKKKVANFDPSTFSVMHCEFCSAGFDTRAGLSSHARAHLRDFGITNWDVTISPIHILRKLFSSRPDLVIPTAPPRSPYSGQDDEDDDEEEEEADEDEIIEIKLERETSEKRIDDISTVSLNSASSGLPYEKPDGREGDRDDEEEVEPVHLDAVGLSSSPKKSLLQSVDHHCLSPKEDEDTKGAGMSRHARSNLGQGEFNIFDRGEPSSDLLGSTSEEQNLDSQINSPHLEPHSVKGSSLFDSENHKDKGYEEGGDMKEKAIPLSVLTKVVRAMPSPSCSTPTPSPGDSPILAHASSPSSVVRKAPISSLLPVSSPLRFTEHKSGVVKSLTSNLLNSANISPSKPIWAPQENDAPLNLTLEVEPNKDIVCQLCGAWFETRKGLSSHARAHLRHFGVEYSESKGSPITLLNQLMDSDDFKRKANEIQHDTESRIPTVLSSPKKAILPSSSPSLLYKVTAMGGGSTSKTTSPSSYGPPAKRLKSSSMQVFRLNSGELMALPHSEPTKEIGCEFCGEYFENRKGLSSHARSHLRQLGITEWSVNGSPIDTLREIISRRGLPCARPLKPHKTPPSSPGPPRSPLSSCSSPSTLVSRIPFSCSSSPPQAPGTKSNSTPPMSSGGLIVKLKPEPVQLEVTTPEAVGSSRGFTTDPISSSWRVSDNAFPLNLAMSREVEPTRDIRCEFCGEYFENRKGLSSHARSHLRQMGITEWSVNGSPIDTLRVIIHKKGLSVSSKDGEVKKEAAKSRSWANATKSSGGSCTLGYPSSKLYKSPLTLSSESKHSKQGLNTIGPLSSPTSPKIVRISPLGKHPEGAESMDTSNTVLHQRKTFAPLPNDFPLRKKPSPVKHFRKDPSCELCGFCFENRKALASHARAHLRQFGVTEWCVNGSPIETLSAWIHSRPQKVLEMHRSYMQSNRPTSKRQKSNSPLPASMDSNHRFPFSQKASSSSSSSSSQWSSPLVVNLVRPLSRDTNQGSFKTVEGEAGSNNRASHIRPASTSTSPTGLVSSLPLQAQVARSELNVRLPRGFERRPLKHPSSVEGNERDSGSPKPPRTSTVPALVPKPPAYPLVKLVGKFYTLKCRFCEVEFHGPLSVQEDWIRHLQQHILKMNYNKPVESKADGAEVVPDKQAPVGLASMGNSSSMSSLTPAMTSSIAANGHSPNPAADLTPNVAEIVKISEELTTAAPIAPPPQVV
ncbi:protein Wiz isoform X1 [Stigmatopora nigra]